MGTGNGVPVGVGLGLGAAVGVGVAVAVGSAWVQAPSMRTLSIKMSEICGIKRMAVSTSEDIWQVRRQYPIKGRSELVRLTVGV